LLLKRLSYRDESAFELNAIQKVAKSALKEKLNSGVYSLEKFDRCGVCDSANFETIGERDRHGLSHRVTICRVCGIVAANPRMDDESLNSFYQSEYRPLYMGADKPKREFFESQLYRGQRIHSFLSMNGFINSKAYVLEVGCGAGGILRYFEKKGHETIGIDLGDQYVNYGIETHGLNLQVGSLKSIQLDKKPDVVIYSHVLEHLTSPIDELICLKDLITDQTIVYVEVPGIFNLKKHYRWDILRYLQNAHNYYFSLSSLSNVLFKSGYQILMGDESVRVVARLGKASYKLENDYSRLTEFLKRMEWQRLFYSISLDNFMMQTTRGILFLLNLFNLRSVAKKALGRKA